MMTFDVEDDFVPEHERFTPERLHRIASAVDVALATNIIGKIDVAFVNEDEMRRLNRMYRGNDAVTDVLSFVGDDAAFTGHLGDVVISYDQALRQSDDDTELELADLLVHGILHVLGYDHERAEDADVMFPLQDSIIADVL